MKRAKLAKKTKQKLIEKMATRKALKQNAEAFKSYGYYKETSDLIDRTDVALGRKPAFKSATSSTLNFEINQHGVASTTA